MLIKVKTEAGKKALDMLVADQKKRYIAVEVNGKLEELNYIFKEDKEVELNFLDLSDINAVNIYEASLRYLVSLALKTIDPKLDCRFFYNISRSIFCRVISKKKQLITPVFVDKIFKRMKEIVELDVPFTRERVTKEEAITLYHQQGFIDKINTLKYRPENFVHLYSCEAFGIKYCDYPYSQMVPSSGYLKDFILRYYDPGFLIQTPRAECGGKIPAFEDEIKFATTLADSSKWSESNHLDTPANINRFLKRYGATALINISESRINEMLVNLVNDIVKDDHIERLICIAGPSSSGKTSFANRLTYALMSKGLRPVRISIDDFYIPRDQLSEDADLESLDSIDVDFFNTAIVSLLSGEEVRMPRFDFKSGKRTFLKPLQTNYNQPLIIEGIHALNNRLGALVPEHQKYRIYIAPQPQLNIDNHTPMSMTDLRLLRRICRDARTRGSDAKATISMWPSVRKGEFKYIYPGEENADFVFESFLPYEPCALRNLVVPLLNKVSPDDKEYATAIRLKSLLKYFLPIDTDDVPCNSLMREFIGGSSFKDAR